MNKRKPKHPNPDKASDPHEIKLLECVSKQIETVAGRLFGIPRDTWWDTPSWHLLLDEGMRLLRSGFDRRDLTLILCDRFSEIYGISPTPDPRDEYRGYRGL